MLSDKVILTHPIKECAGPSSAMQRNVIVPCPGASIAEANHGVQPARACGVGRGPERHILKIQDYTYAHN